MVTKNLGSKIEKPNHLYVVSEMASKGTKKYSAPSIVDARRIAYQLVIKSGYRKAYHIEDVGKRRGYADWERANVYYTGLYRSVVADYSTEDETILYQLKADGRHGFLLCSYDY